MLRNRDIPPHFLQSGVKIPVMREFVPNLKTPPG